MADVNWKYTNCPCETINATVIIETSHNGYSYSLKAQGGFSNDSGSFEIPVSDQWVRIRAVGNSSWPSPNCILVLSCATDSVIGYDVRVAYSSSQVIELMVLGNSYSMLTVNAFTLLP